MFRCQKGSHDLCDTGRVLNLVCIFGVEHCACYHIYQNGRFSLDFRSLRPVFNTVCIGSLFIVFCVRNRSGRGSYNRSPVLIIFCCGNGNCGRNSNYSTQKSAEYFSDMFYFSVFHVQNLSDYSVLSIILCILSPIVYHTYT